jgi:hypothetical protein
VAQRSRATIIAVTTSLALAGLVFVVAPRAIDGPSALVVSPTDQEAADRSARPRAWVATPEVAPREHGDLTQSRATVKFEGGLLAIRARAVPLDEILAAVTDAVGISFVGAEDARDAVSIDAGPGPVPQVLSALFAGAHYGYALRERADGAAGTRPARVILLRQSETLPQRTTDASAGPRRPVPMPDQAMPVSADAPGVRQQKVLDELLEACKQQGCDTS